MASRLLKLTTVFIVFTLSGKLDCQYCTDKTCDNGIGCYYEEERCDQIYQCLDHSDEIGEFYVLLPLDP